MPGRTTRDEWETAALASLSAWRITGLGDSSMTRP